MALQASNRKLTGFAPDLDPVTAGVIVDGNDFVPTMQGLRTLPELVQVTQALPSPCRGAAALTFQDGSQWIVAGTANGQLWAVLGSSLDQAAPPAWIPNSTPFTPVLNDITRWRFAIYNELIIAVDGRRPPFKIDEAGLLVGAWQVLGGNPPVSAIVATSDFSVFLIEADPVTGNPTATWHSSASAEIWTDDVATETVSGRLWQTSGPITAAKALRNTMILYKANATYIGNLVPQYIWSFAEASRQVGAQSHESVVSVQDAHEFFGPDDLYSFDGFSLNRLPNALREWLSLRANSTNLSFALGRFDDNRSLAFWYYSTVSSGSGENASEWITMNARTGQWMPGQLAVEAAIQQPIVYVPSLPLPSQLATGGLFREDHALWLYAAQTQERTMPAFFTMGDIGDRHFMYQVTRARPGFVVVNGTPTLSALNSYTPGAAYTPGASTDLSADGWFNLVNTARLQRYRLDTIQDVEIADMEFTVQAVGDV